ncbi:hypothetical protein OB69_10210 [Roseivirga seohaensis subsp. aquiponti]|uniref:Macroglobulin domain-containing protein n=2 Tax=Roseivirga seohaensis TaxID=1914963 RepID=A0A0L8AKC7_9BACT|nr:hypothetical protein OB69_10210 [Roseivirga seohaensis subsp. aquiponti]
MGMKITHIRTNRFLAIITLFFVAIINALAQTENVRERVFIDVNTHDLLVGETLQYSTFCLSNTTNKPSALSKYLYVELIGEGGVVFQRKHQLENGKASGEFFIPSNIETGKYYLVAYTRWMRNFDDVTQAPLIFINPYKGHTNADVLTEDVTVEFNTVSGVLIANTANNVVFKVSQGNKPLIRKGRVISEDGKQIVDINSDANGFGAFEITPEKGKSYQMLIENPEGGFKFFNLPSATDTGVGLNILHTNAEIELKPYGDVKGGRLYIEHQGNVVLERDVQSTYPIRIKRTELPYDVLRVSFKDNQGRLSYVVPLFNTKLGLETSPTILETRSPAVIEQQLAKGNYSVSIRKSFGNQTPQMHAAFSKEGLSLPENLDYTELQNAASFYRIEEKELPTSISFLPEYRYQLLEGVLKAESGLASVENKNVILSLTGEKILNMSVARTDSEGRFLLEYQTMNRGEQTDAHLAMPEFESEYSFEISDNFKKQHQLDFSPVIIDTAQLAEIRERSIISQLENAYFTPLIDSSEIENNILPTMNAFNAHYEFDDYVRFRTLKEHLVEYISVAGVRERRGVKRFVVYDLDSNFDFELESLVLLDGVPVHAPDLLEFSPYRIKSVDIANKRYFLGSYIADGVLSFKTIEGNLGGFEIKNNHMAFSLLTPEAESKTAGGNPLEDLRTPDARIQLLWAPEYEVAEDGVEQIQFNTSDVEGDFELVIEGFTEEGIPVSIIKKIKVKERTNEKG